MSTLSRQILIDDKGNVEVVQAPPPLPQTLRDIKRLGRIATLVDDPHSPYWNFTPRRPGDLDTWPQTSVFNHVPAPRKGKRLPLTPRVLAHVEFLNGSRNADRLYNPSTGWINSKTETPQVDKISPTSESLSWAANHVIVMEERIHRGEWYCRIYAEDSNSILRNTFFSPDGRLVTHAYNAIHRDGHMTKHGSGQSLYTPLTSPGELWCAKEELAFWPSLPFVDDEGGTVIEYSLLGYQIFGVRADRSQILLRDTSGFRTSWSLPIPEVPG